MRFANGILKYLKKNGVDYVFGIPAGTISPLFDALNDIGGEVETNLNYAAMGLAIGGAIGV